MVLIMKQYDFNADLLLSKKAEERFGKFLENSGFTNVEYAPDGLFEDWDIKTDQGTYEVKFDRWIKNTNNLCVESYSCLERSSKGWFFKTHAEWLIVFEDEDTFYSIKMADLKILWFEKPELWTRQKIEQTSWTTICWLISLDDIPFKVKRTL